MTHNRLVTGSSPVGATKQNKELDEKSSDSFLFRWVLGQLGKFRNQAIATDTSSYCDPIKYLSSLFMSVIHKAYPITSYYHLMKYH